MKLRSGKTTKASSAWTPWFEKRMISKHTVGREKARQLSRLVNRMVQSGGLELPLVPNALLQALLLDRKDNGPALISVDTAIELERDLPACPQKKALQGGIVLATFDTWNLHKLDVHDSMFCYAGEFGEGPPFEAHTDPVAILDRCKRWAAMRHARVKEDFIRLTRP